MSIQTRNSAAAILVESAEGTPVAASGATDFLALQDDFSMEPAFDEISNAELRSSLGTAKAIMGFENPSASFSHYIRHSGVEGQAPAYGSTLLKASFGAEEVQGTEYNTVAACTTSVIKVDSGEGTNYRRLQPLLIKDSTNGYEIRPIYSISSDDLTMLFNVGTAPGVGVELGKSILYYPVDTGHQSLTLWHYLGNAGAVQMMAGARPTSLSISIAAGELINASYSLEGVEYYWNPMTTSAANFNLDFTDDDGTVAVVVAADVWKTPHDLAEALTTAMNDSGTTETHSVTYSDSAGKFTIATSTSAVLTLLWKTGTSGADGTDAHIGTLLGYSDGADDSGATSYVSDTAQSWVASFTPSFDAADPLVAKDNEVLIGDADDITCFAASSVDITFDTPRRTIDSICAASGRSGSIINARECSVSVSALLTQHDADKFYRMKENSDTRFCFNFGTKSGGNWEAGKCGCFNIPTCTVTSVTVEDDDGLASLSLELKAFVDDDGNTEVGLGFV